MYKEPKQIEFKDLFTSPDLQPFNYAGLILEVGHITVLQGESAFATTTALSLVNALDVNCIYIRKQGDPRIIDLVTQGKISTSVTVAGSSRSLLYWLKNSPALDSETDMRPKLLVVDIGSRDISVMSDLIKIAKEHNFSVLWVVDGDPLIVETKLRINTHPAFGDANAIVTFSSGASYGSVTNEFLFYVSKESNLLK